MSISMDELVAFVNSQSGDFMIRVEFQHQQPVEHAGIFEEYHKAIQ